MTPILFFSISGWSRNFSAAFMVYMSTALWADCQFIQHVMFAVHAFSCASITVAARCAIFMHAYSPFATYATIVCLMSLGGMTSRDITRRRYQCRGRGRGRGRGSGHGRISYRSAVRARSLGGATSKDITRRRCQGRGRGSGHGRISYRSAVRARSLGGATSRDITRRRCQGRGR